MRRREFIAFGCSTAIALPFEARGQQNQQIRRVGVLMSQTSSTDVSQSALAAFLQRLGQLGWKVEGNLHVEVRWAAGAPELYRRYAAELLSYSPDVILTHYAAIRILRNLSGAVPIVFVLAIDPVGAGDVVSLAHPGGNATGFLLFDYNIASKWLELLKEIAPSVVRVAVLRDPTTAAGIGQFSAIQSSSSQIGVEVSPIDARDIDLVEREISAFAREPNTGLISTASTFQAIHRKEIIAMAARYRQPTIYPFRLMTTDGGLISYGPDAIDPYRRAASYVDRILRGEKPADLPVQAPTKHELVINLKTAKSLGLVVPGSLLAFADDVIE